MITCIRFWVGLVVPYKKTKNSPGSKAQSIVTWCADRGVDVYACTIAETQYFGTCYARVSVAEEFEQTLLDKEFWPDTIAHTVRKWRYADSASK